MPRYPLQFQSTDQNGHIIVDATVTITLTGTDTAAVTYSASSGGTDDGGVYTTDADGRIKAWLDDADYSGTDYFRITVSGPRFITQVLDDIIIMPIASAAEASLALDNLVAVAINTSLVSDTADTDDLGTEAKPWKKIYLGSGGISIEGASDDAFQTTINVIDPTADRALTLPNISGTIMTANSVDVIINKTSIDIGGTTLLASRLLTIDTGGVFNIALSSAAGDDFQVDTDKLVVRGDAALVGMGIGVPLRNLHIYENTTTGGDNATLRMEQAGTGDVLLEFLLTAQRAWQFGVDNSDSDKLKITGTASSTWANTFWVLDVNAQMGVGTDSPLAGTHIAGDGEADSSPSTSTTVGGAVLIQDTGAGVGNGGKLMLSATASGVAANFCMIKGWLTDGANNTAGHLDFYTRHAAADASLTHRIRITSDGNVGFGTEAIALTNISTFDPRLYISGSGVDACMQVVRHTTPGGGGSQLILSSTKGTDANDHSILADNEGLGGLSFNGSDGNQFISGGLIKCKVDGTPGANDMPTEMVFEVNAGAAATTEVMRLDPAGELSLKSGTLELSDGGTVTQITSRTTGVTINTYSGQITTDTTSLAANAEAIFTVTNSKVKAFDTCVINLSTGRTSNTIISIAAIGAGFFNVMVSNVGPGAETGAMVLNFTVLRGAAS